ncbi:MAG: two-component sensor histidine kinase [Clostridia bacterium]|nr:two-component sensor histidine kinase [Clostridia bacterium]
MAGKILKSILTVAIVVLLASLVVITGLLYQDFTQIQHTQLKDELRFTAAAAEQLGIAYLEDLPSDNYRLTWIADDGTVLFDSRADSESMENHADREEIREAMENAAGSSTRFSYTLTERTIYEAVRLTDGSVLRISVSSESVASLLVHLLSPIAAIAVLAILLSVWLARRMAKQVVEPLNHLNLDEPLSNNTYEELSPLLQRLDSQHREIQYQIQLLQCGKQEFDQITGNMKEALVLLNPDCTIISINPAAMKLFGIGSSGTGSTFCPEGYETDMSDAIADAKKQGHAEFTASVREAEYLFNISRIEADGMVYGIVILAFDVTEQANAERMRRDFTSNVSHELKTPLQSIIGSAELMENGIVKPEDMPRFLGHIRKEASRLVTLIEDIIRLGQLDEGKSLQKENVSLLTLAAEVQDTLLYAAEEKNVTVTVSGDVGEIYGVQSLLYELVYNLVDNAIRYNKDGGSVTITVEDRKDNVCLSAADTGIGIAAEHHSKIFERFYRVDKSHSRKSGGTGLGLSIVKHAVKYHGGTIAVDSAVGKGTSITVTLQKRHGCMG